MHGSVIWKKERSESNERGRPWQQVDGMAQPVAGNGLSTCSMIDLLFIIHALSTSSVATRGQDGWSEWRNALCESDGNVKQRVSYHAQMMILVGRSKYTGNMNLSSYDQCDLFRRRLANKVEIEIERDMDVGLAVPALAQRREPKRRMTRFLVPLDVSPQNKPARIWQRHRGHVHGLSMRRLIGSTRPTRGREVIRRRGFTRGRPMMGRTYEVRGAGMGVDLVARHDL